MPILLVADGDDYVVTSYNLTGDNTTGTRSQDLTIALSTTALLADYPRRCGLTPAEVYFNQDVIAARGWEESAVLQLDRSFVTNPDDSGWFIQPFPQVDPDREWQVDELTRLKVYEVLAARPAAAHVMGLPIGVVAVITDDNVRAIFNGNDGTILWDDRGD